MCDSEHSGHFLTSSFGSPIKAERVVQEDAANNNEVFTRSAFLNYACLGIVQESRQVQHIDDLLSLFFSPLLAVIFLH